MYTTLSHLRALCVHHRVFGFVVTIILLSMTTGVSSQTPEWMVENTENSGLPYNQVIALAFDSQDNLWIGTNHRGLAKFDGETWAVYNTGNSGLPSDQVTALAFDARGTLWIGTGGGLVRFDGETWMVHDKDNSGLPNNFIWILALDTQGNTWIGTYGGLAVYREGGVILKGMNK